MRVWALADLHLSFGVANKKMDVFGEKWIDHPKKIAAAWQNQVHEEDLVLIPGDISWAINLAEALPDLEWIHALPGTKVILRGNHDYWWSSLSKMKKFLPPSIHPIHNNSFEWEGISIGGSRLWDNPAFNFSQIIQVIPTPISALPGPPLDADKQLWAAQQRRIFERELGRLELSLKQLNPKAKKRIAMTHYPPVSTDLEDSEVSSLLEKYNVDACVFGHLHNVEAEGLIFGEKNGIRYIFAACDYTDFIPVPVF